MTDEELEREAENLICEVCPKGLPNADMVIVRDAIAAFARRIRDDAISASIAAIRFEKYQNRGEGLEDSDPHSDDNPDYIRAAIDEALENAVERINKLNCAIREGK